MGEKNNPNDQKPRNWGENARNYRGELSEQSKERRRQKKLNETSEGLVEGLRKTGGHLPRKKIKPTKKR